MLIRAFARSPPLLWQPCSRFARPKKPFNKDVDYYAILNIKRTAELPAIKKNFYEFSKKYHPDLNTITSTTKGIYEEIKEAYDILSNTELRKEYDAFLKEHGKPEDSKPEEEDYSSTGPYQDYEEYRQFAGKSYSHHTKAEWNKVRMGLRTQSYISQSSAMFAIRGVNSD
jgi:DnaJ-class molecular chaperone